MRPISDDTDRGRVRAVAPAEDPIEVSRYVEALRRSRWLMLAIVVIVTGAVIAVSLALPKNYEASSNIVINSTAGAGGSTETIERELATIATLVTTRPVLEEAARSVPHETASSLEGHVSTSVDQNANIIHVNVASHDARNAAQLAYAVSQAFLHQRATAQRAAATSALATLDAEIEALRARGAANPAVASQLAALETRAGELESTRASSGSGLQLEQPPTVPSAPTSPRPTRNAVIALFAALFLAILVALAREQLTPRVTNQRELGKLLELPVLGGIPYTRRRVNARSLQAEHETYQTLSAALQLALPPATVPQIVLVTSAGHSEGKTTVTVRLARMLSRAGHPTLIVSGDLRAPRLDDELGIDGRPGMRDVLAGNRAGISSARGLDDFVVSMHTNGAASRGAALDVLPAGNHASGPVEYLQAAALEPLFSALRESPYTYVLVDSPPILGIADSQMLAQFADDLLLVARLDRLTMTKVIDLRDILDRVSAHKVGLVVIGTRPSESPYYASEEYVVAPS